MIRLPMLDPAPSDSIERAVVQGVRARTHDRVRNLRVDLSQDRVTVRGETATYHVKQLAVAAVVEVLSDTPARLLHCAIEVHSHD